MLGPEDLCGSRMRGLSAAQDQTFRMLLAGRDATLMLLRAWRICNSHVRKSTTWEPCFKVLSLGWLSDGLSVAATRFSGTTGGIVAVRTNTAIVIPGRLGLRSHFSGYYLRCLCGYIRNLDPTLPFRPSSPCLS